MSEPDIAGVMASAMDAENRRRELASQRPGHGALLPMEQPAAAAAVGKSSLDMPVIGEGYDMAPEVSPAVHKAYGPDRPVYADPLVSGYGFTAGRQEAPITVYIGSRSSADGVALVSPAQPSLWSRLLSRVRAR